MLHSASEQADSQVVSIEIFMYVKIIALAFVKVSICMYVRTYTNNCSLGTSIYGIY